jgi:hypothetical protein
MPLWLKATSKWGSILVLVALVIALVKQLIAFIGFLTFAIKILIVLAFVVLFVAVGFAVFRAMSRNRKPKSES